MLEHWAEPELIPQMLDYAVPVAEEEFSLEESIETIPLQLPPDFARRLANMPMSGPVAITDEPTTIGLSQQSGMSQQIGLSQTNLTPAIDTSLEEEDSMEATRFEVPSLPNQNLNTNNNRLHIVTSQLKAFILLNDLNHGQRKYLAIALSVTMILLVTVVIVIVVKAINSDDDTESPKTEAVAVAENDKTADNPDKPSDDINNSKDKADEETPKNNEDNAADAKEDKPAADDDKKDKESSPGSDDADTPNNENTESDKDTDKKSANNNASDAQYPIFSFTLKYSPANAKVTFTHAEGKCGAGKCSLKTTSTTNPAAIVISANGYKKQRLVIKKEAPVYSAYLKKDAPKKANTGKKTNTGKKPVI
jgi:cytoskeletal protein RodZ